MGERNKYPECSVRRNSREPALVPREDGSASRLQQEFHFGIFADLPLNFTIIANMPSIFRLLSK
jgi:hypothetical protein